MLYKDKASLNERLSSYKRKTPHEKNLKISDIKIITLNDR